MSYTYYLLRWELSLLGARSVAPVQAEMRHFFSRNLFMKVIEGFLIISNRSEEKELAVLSLKNVFAFVKELKSVFKTRPFLVPLCPDCYFSDTKFIFHATEIPLSSVDVFEFLYAVGANVNYMLMSNVRSVSHLVLLKDFCFFLAESVGPDEADNCLRSLQFGRASFLLTKYVSEKSEDTEKNQEEVLKFFLYHHKMLRCYFDLQELFKP